ncbi:hypothetical protein BCEP27_40165 [Burkholderia cepacia]
MSHKTRIFRHLNWEGGGLLGGSVLSTLMRLL